jgi:hypothetical protein
MGGLTTKRTTGCNRACALNKSIGINAHAIRSFASRPKICVVSFFRSFYQNVTTEYERF